MSDLVRMQIKGMTCAHCEAIVATALRESGARDVKVDHRRSEAVFSADRVGDLASYREAISRAGYDAASEEVLQAELHSVPIETRRAAEREGWMGTLALVALPVLCCGLPLLAAALVSTGAGAWLVAHGSLLAVPVLGLAVGLFIWRSARKRAR